MTANAVADMVHPQPVSCAPAPPPDDILVALPPEWHKIWHADDRPWPRCLFHESAVRLIMTRTHGAGPCTFSAAATGPPVAAAWQEERTACDPSCSRPTCRVRSIAAPVASAAS